MYGTNPATEFLRNASGKPLDRSPAPIAIDVQEVPSENDVPYGMKATVENATPWFCSSGSANMTTRGAAASRVADVTSPGLNALDEHGSHCNVTIPDSVLVVNPFVPPRETEVIRHGMQASGKSEKKKISLTEDEDSV